MSEIQERDPREEVAQIFTSAGWTAGVKDGWDGQFIFGSSIVVGGTDPWGVPRVTTQPSMSRPEAAAWLVQHAIEQAPNPLTTEATLDPIALQTEEGESLGDESNGETGEASDGGSGVFAGSGDAVSDSSELDGSESVDASGSEYAALQVESDPIDADFTIEDLGGPDEQLALGGADPEDFAPDEFAPQEDQSGAFIFGDNLHQLRTAAIGLVVQSALTRLPAAMDYAKLSELRNFAMGVSENRWPDDPAKRDELDALEAIERRRRAIETERDAKVAWIVEASREDLEAFDPEANWP